MEEKIALLFNDYLQNNLSEKERDSFENRLKKDPVLAKQYHTFRDLYNNLENKFSKERASLKHDLDKAGEDYFNTTKTKKEVKVFKLKPWYYSVAASVILLFGLYNFIFKQGISYTDYSFSEKISLTERNTSSQLLKKAETAFNSKNYLEAIDYFNLIISDNPNYNELLFYKGVALVEINSLTAAELVFTKLQESNSIYKNKALFYLALIKLKQKDYKECKKILQTLPETAEDFNNAQEILRELN